MFFSRHLLPRCLPNLRNVIGHHPKIYLFFLLCFNVSIDLTAGGGNCSNSSRGSKGHVPIRSLYCWWSEKKFTVMASTGNFVRSSVSDCNLISDAGSLPTSKQGVTVARPLMISSSFLHPSVHFVFKASLKSNHGIICTTHHIYIIQI